MNRPEGRHLAAHHRPRHRWPAHPDALAVGQRPRHGPRPRQGRRDRDEDRQTRIAIRRRRGWRRRPRSPGQNRRSRRRHCCLRADHHDPAGLTMRWAAAVARKASWLRSSRHQRVRVALKAPRWAWVRSATQRPGMKPRCSGRPVLRGSRGMSGVKPSAAMPARKAASSKAPSAANANARGPAAGRGGRRRPRRTRGRARRGRRSPPTSTLARAGRGATVPLFRARQRRLHVAAVHGEEPPVDHARGVRGRQALPVRAPGHAGSLPLAGAAFGRGRRARPGRVERPPGAAPVRTTDRIASIARRAGTGGRPPLGRPRMAGSSGSIAAHGRSGKRHASIGEPSSDLHDKRTSGSNGRL